MVRVNDYARTTSAFMAFLVALGLIHVLDGSAAGLRADRWPAALILLFVFLGTVLETWEWPVASSDDLGLFRRRARLADFAGRIGVGLIALRGCYAATISEFLWWMFAVIAAVAGCEVVRRFPGRFWHGSFKINLCRLFLLTVSLRLAAHPLGTQRWLGWSVSLWPSVLGIAALFGWEVNHGLSMERLENQRQQTLTDTLPCWDADHPSQSNTTGS